MRGMQCNVEFRYQLSTCSKDRENPRKLVKTLFKDSVGTSKRTPHFTITKINLLRLFKEIIAVYIETHTTPMNTECTITDW
jgi:predicted metal-dependent phosphoesterase TrpH